MEGVIKMIYSDYKQNTGQFINITEDGTYYFITPPGTNSITAMWETPDIAKSGTLKFEIAGDEGTNPAEGTLDLASGVTTIITGFAIPVLDIIATGIPTGATVRILFGRY